MFSGVSVGQSSVFCVVFCTSLYVPSFCHCIDYCCLSFFDLQLLMTCNLLKSTEPSWPWSYGSWIYNYLCKQCLSPLQLWMWIPLRRGVLDTTLCDKVCQWLTTGWWFSRGTPVSTTNKTDHHDLTEILLKVALNTITITLTLKSTSVNIFIIRGPYFCKSWEPVFF